MEAGLIEPFGQYSRAGGTFEVLRKQSVSDNAVKKQEQNTDGSAWITERPDFANRKDSGKSWAERVSEKTIQKLRKVYYNLAKQYVLGGYGSDGQF